MNNGNGIAAMAIHPPLGTALSMMTILSHIESLSNEVKDQLFAAFFPNQPERDVTAFYAKTVGHIG